jgi:hypothetical protein
MIRALIDARRRLWAGQRLISILIAAHQLDLALAGFIQGTET